MLRVTPAVPGRLARGVRAYRLVRSGDACVEVLLKRNCSSHALAVGFPSTTGGENSQRSAAFIARPAKYLLGPADLNFAAVTLPDGSTST